MTFHALSTSLSHKATFTVLSEIRKKCLEKLAKIPLGIVLYESSGALKNTLMDKYKDVYQMELLTDNTEKTKAFYRSVGFINSDEVGCVSFIRM